MLSTLLVALCLLFPAYSAAQAQSEAPLSEHAFSLTDDEKPREIDEDFKKVFSTLQIEKNQDKQKDFAMSIVGESLTKSQEYLEESRKDLIKLTRLVDESLGIKRQEGTLLVFVSHSMSDGYIRSYLQEAAWAGGSLFTRGIPAGMSIKTYIFEKLLPIVQERAGTSISIDPRKFGIYGITQVPTIVWDPGENALCSQFIDKVENDDHGKPQTVSACEGTDDEFWKISGSVTIDYALRQFAEAGAPGAANRLAILRKNIAPKPGGYRNQPSFEGDWSKAKLPTDEIDDLKLISDRERLEPQNGILSDTTTIEGK